MTQDETNPEELQALISEAAVSKRWRKSRRTVQRWRAAGRMPPQVQIGSTVFYYVKDIVAHEANAQSSNLGQA